MSAEYAIAYWLKMVDAAAQRSEGKVASTTLHSWFA
jgi:hypothetical protein